MVQGFLSTRILLSKTAHSYDPRRGYKGIDSGFVALLRFSFSPSDTGLVKNDFFPLLDSLVEKANELIAKSKSYCCSLFLSAPIGRTKREI